MSRNRPEIGPSRLAEACFDYLVSTPEELARFMAETGMSADELRRGPTSPALITGLMDYFAHHEQLLAAACAGAGIPVESFMREWHRANPSG